MYEARSEANGWAWYDEQISYEIYSVKMEHSAWVMKLVIKKTYASIIEYTAPTYTICFKHALNYTKYTKHSTYTTIYTRMQECTQFWHQVLEVLISSDCTFLLFQECTLDSGIPCMAVLTIVVYHCCSDACLWISFQRLFFSYWFNFQIFSGSVVHVFIFVFESTVLL